MKKDLKRWLQIGAGVFLIILGIAGLVLPILQGIALIVLGVMLISPAHGKKMAKKGKQYWKKIKKWWKKKK